MQSSPHTSRPQTIDEQLVLRVNEIFHDVEGPAYENRHPEIFRDEVQRWKRIAARFIAPSAGPLRLLDIGSGTGFVPLQVGLFLQADDTLICSDLSAAMLRACERNVSAAGLACRCEYSKLDGRTLGGRDASCDFVTLNSVLHHIPDLPAFLAEIDRVLKPGGRLIVGHEPNKRFYQRPAMRFREFAAAMLFAPKHCAASALRELGLINLAKGALRPIHSGLSAQQRTVHEVNRRLLDERMITEPLTADRITELVDIRSPTAGGFHRDRGIDPHEIIAGHLPGYVLEHLETYNHLGDHVSSRNRLTRWYQERLRATLPHDGATFLAVYRKLNPSCEVG